MSRIVVKDCLGDNHHRATTLDPRRPSAAHAARPLVAMQHLAQADKEPCLRLSAFRLQLSAFPPLAVNQLQPLLQAAGRDADPHFIAEQPYFTAGRIFAGAKLSFDISEYAGTATRSFADPAFGGDPAFATQEEIDEHGRTKDAVVLTAENAENAEKEPCELHEAPPRRNASPQPSAFSPRPLAFFRPALNQLQPLLHAA